MQTVQFRPSAQENIRPAVCTAEVQERRSVNRLSRHMLAAPRLRYSTVVLTARLFCPEGSHQGVRKIHPPCTGIMSD